MTGESMTLVEYLVGLLGAVVLTTTICTAYLIVEYARDLVGDAKWPIEATRDVPVSPVPYYLNPRPPYEIVWTTGKGTTGSLTMSGDVSCLAV